MQLQQGSTWNKWDLHVHTPTSLVHYYKGGDNAWEQFITELEGLPPEFTVLGINDYMEISGYERLLEERAGV